MKYNRQTEWQKDNMKQIKVSYKSEFVEEFRNACVVLDKPQSAILKEKMEDAIVKANKLMEYVNGLKSKYGDAIIKLYEYAFGEYEDDRFLNDVRYDYINEYIGTDDKTMFLWYFDNDNNNIAVNLATNELLTDEEDIQKYVMPY